MTRSFSSSGRRSFLRGAAAAGTALALGPSFASRARADTVAPRLLFVIGASGGASIIDSFLPLPATQASGPSPNELIAYPDVALTQLPGSAFRVVKNLDNLGVGGSPLFRCTFEHSELVRAHGQDMLVATVQNTSVNHVVAQSRAMNGAGIDGGRTILEAAAMTHGEGMILPAVNLASGGYLEPGTHAAVPDWARAEIVNDPIRFAASTDGSRGLFPTGDRRMPRAGLLARARATREQLEDLSPLAMRTSPMRSRYLELRRTLQPRMEAADLIDSLMLVSSGFDLAAYGLSPSPAIEEMGLLDVFPHLLEDRFQAQTCLAYLLAREGLSAAIAWGPGFAPSFLADGTITDTPISFDFSHNDHVTTQNVMWARVASQVDALARLLKATPTSDGTLWDRSLVYVATDFGRDRTRPAGATGGFGTGHHLSNGNVFLSPLLRGNTVLGGVATDTALTDGWDPTTGARTPGRNDIREGHLYSIVASALGIDFPNRLDVRAAVR
ncbi:MAG: hypothetical protein K1X94_18580 [Sandaracinaceae bacterium]|nr:hypothetical protein [Sandaracinaceae bacterium]